MSRPFPAFVLILSLIALLAGCVPALESGAAPIVYAPPAAAPAEEPPSATPAFDPQFDTGSGGGDVLTTDPLPEGGTPAQDGAAPEPPSDALLAQQRAACEREGGRFMPRGTGFYTCVFQTSDGGRQCQAAADCEGACLARSRTCAPFRPIFGCQEVFTLPGRRETLCTE